MTETNETVESTDFVREIVASDLAEGRYDRVQTRFPPEPNGYLHIGHAKAIIVDFEIANDFDGVCNLRFDDTNPVKEEQEYVDSQIEDLKWLGYEPANVYFASDYFEQLYDMALKLIRQGDAYVDDLSPDEMREYRGTLTEPGKESPWRDRPVEENLDLFARMRAGEFQEGSRTLRAKIDMKSGNINMRDPVMYRILHAEHHRTGSDWHIYPMYDWAHGQSDSIEGVTHSFCSLEYESHRPLYEWFIEKLDIFAPRQVEFARLNITYTVLSKRRLNRLVAEGFVDGWDDPRMPTLAAMRRRGVPAKAIRDFVDRVGLAKTNSTVEVDLLEYFIRQDLNDWAQRKMGVLEPLKVTITNWPEGKVEMVEAVNNPENEADGTRQIPFSGTLYIEKEDFMEDAPRKYYRLTNGKEVRLRWGYFIKANEVIKDEDGNVIEVRCTYDPETKGGYAPDNRRPNGTIHWVSAEHAVDAEVRLYDRLFMTENPDDVADGQDFTDNLNPESLAVVQAKVEPSVADLPIGQTIQFERKGYYCLDESSTPDNLIVNQTITLRDSWAKIKKKGR